MTLAQPRTHHYKVRVYYEDTDAGGVVYHSQYLNFMERARTEALSNLGFELKNLKEQHGVLFAVRHISIDFNKPAVLGDWLLVETHVHQLRGASVIYRQRIYRSSDAIILCHATIRMACVNASMKPTPLPSEIKRSLGL